MSNNTLRELIQSGNINLLIGAGASVPFFPPLGDIEKKMNSLVDTEVEAAQKEYLEKVMLPNIEILKGTETSPDFLQTLNCYKSFFESLLKVLIKRKSTILTKQVNIFTTNIDILMECALEEIGADYNDGFIGKITSTFGVENFKRSIHQHSLHFGHISEIPTFNLVKLHGSVNWQVDDKGEIVFSEKINHFDNSLLSKGGIDFSEGYKKIQVVNPRTSKYSESVLNIYYYELLRLYSSELEKENAILFVIGFSMQDGHIREITLRAAKSNPTLRIIIFLHSHGKKEDMMTLMEANKHRNIEFIEPTDDASGNKLNLCKINGLYFKDIIKQSAHEEE